MDYTWFLRSFNLFNFMTGYWAKPLGFGIDGWNTQEAALLMRVLQRDKGLLSI